MIASTQYKNHQCIKKTALQTARRLALLHLTTENIVCIHCSMKF